MTDETTRNPNEGFYLPVEEFTLAGGLDDATDEPMIVLRQHMRGGSIWPAGYPIPLARLLLTRLKTGLDVHDALSPKEDSKNAP